jgi:hypothetical protein
MYDNLPISVKSMFIDSGLKKTKGLYDVTDAYYLAKFLTFT